MLTEWKVAIVEDDIALGRAVGRALRRQGYRVRLAVSAEEGIALVRQWSPDVILLDVLLPDSTSLDVFTRFRRETTGGIIGVTALPSLADKVAGLRGGADDYVQKPFAFDELAARVEAVLRRTMGRGSPRMEVADLGIDLNQGLATRAGKPLELSPTEYRLLIVLARSVERVLTRQQLADGVWAVEDAPASNAVEVHIGRLRRKLEVGGLSRMIHTVQGIGYIMKRAGA